MPYKQGKQWRATPQYNGKRLRTALFATKKEALVYEIESKKQAMSKEGQMRHGMDLMSFCIKYLDYAKQYAPKVYKEKQSVTKRILAAWAPDRLVAEITPEDAQQYLDIQAKQRSANAANKDRKNLMAMWGKGIKFFGVKDNPFVVAERKRHDRQPQYTPPSADVLKVLMAATRQERVFLDAYLQTGARRSEIFRWRWADDINFERCEYRLGTRKTADGSMHYEWFPMSDDLNKALKWWWNSRSIKDSPYVFADDQKGAHFGKLYTTRRRFMPGLCERAKVKPFGFHALRRFVASILADSGKSTNAIRRVLRHKNVSTTELYIQNINNDLGETMESLSFDNVFGQVQDAEKKKNST